MAIICFPKKDWLIFVMRIALLTLVFIISVTATAQARLGETADQLVVRYGQPLKETDQNGEGVKIPLADVVFQKGGFKIEVTITDGVSVEESFKKINGDGLNLAEIRTLLNANAQGYGWEAPQASGGQKKWTRDDGAVAALDQGFLTIKSKELMAKEALAKKLEARPSLDGF
jgi:hypothetical protein